MMISRKIKLGVSVGSVAIYVWDKGGSFIIDSCCCSVDRWQIDTRRSMLRNYVGHQRVDDVVIQIICLVSVRHKALSQISKGCFSLNLTLLGKDDMRVSIHLPL